MAVDIAEFLRIEEERRQRAVDTERAVAAVAEEAQRQRELELYERIEDLLAEADHLADARKMVAAPAGAATRRVADATNRVAAGAPLPSESDPADPLRTEPGADAIGKPPAPCFPLGDGWARCPEPLLDRLSLRVIDAEERADVAELRLDEERGYRRLDAEAAVVREAGLTRELERARPAPWKPPVALVSGAAIVAGATIAIAGHEEVGAVVGVAGAIGAWRCGDGGRQPGGTAGFSPPQTITITEV